MKFRFIFALITTAFSINAYPQNVCQIIAGAVIIAHDGKYLGKLSNKYEAESVLNEYGTHGSKYSAQSIWNEYSTYGSEYSNISPFNQYTNSPPKLVKNGKAIAHLTVNRNLQAPLNPFFYKKLRVLLNIKLVL
jgi:hypothetical protein